MSVLTTPPAAPPEDSGAGESPLVRWLAARIPPRAGVPLLLLAGLAVFWPTLHAGFALDDDVHAAMVRGGFQGIGTEWWHFDHGDRDAVRRDLPRVY